MSEICEWSTPKYIFDPLYAEFRFTLDPCATFENKKCDKFYSKEQNGLLQPWSKECVFVNPPYGREIGKWVEKSYMAFRRKTLVVMLIPSRTDTKYWHQFIMKASEIRLIEGRFDETGRAPFPSCVVIFDPDDVQEYPRLRSWRPKKR